MVHEVWVGTIMTPVVVCIVRVPRTSDASGKCRFAEIVPKILLEHWNAEKGDIPKVHVEIFSFPTSRAQKLSYK